MQQTHAGHHPRAATPKLRIAMPSSSPVRDSIVKTPASPTRSLKAALTEIQGVSPYADYLARSPSPRSLERPRTPWSSAVEPEFPVPQLPDIDLRPPERSLRLVHERSQSGSTDFTKPSMPSLDTKLSEYAITDSSDYAEASDMGKGSLSNLRPEPLSARSTNGFVKPIPAHIRSSRSALEQSASEQSVELQRLFAQTNGGERPSSGDGSSSSREGSNTVLGPISGYDKSNNHNASRRSTARPGSEHSLSYPFIAPDDLNALVQKAKTGRNANSEKLKTMLGVYFLTLKEINKSFPSEGESGHGSAEESTGRRTPRSVNETSSAFAAFGHSLPPPPPIPQEPTLARSVRSVSSPAPIRNSGFSDTQSLERLRDSRYKPGSASASTGKKKKTAVVPLPLSLFPDTRKLSDAIGPRTPYPRSGDPLRTQRLSQPHADHLQIPESPHAPNAAAPPSRKASVAVIHNGSLAYIKPSAAHVSSDTILTLFVHRRQAPSCRCVTTLHIPADADQATARKWSTAGLPATAVAVESSITTSTAPAHPGTGESNSGKPQAEKKPVARMSFDDTSFFLGLRKQYNKSLLGSTFVSQFWRRYIAARCLKRIIVVPLDEDYHAHVLPTTLTGNTTGSSAFPGRLSNPFASVARAKEAGRTASAPTLDGHVPRTRSQGGRRSHAPGNRISISGNSVAANGTPRPPANTPVTPNTPRFLARRGLQDTFSEGKMMQSYNRPSKGRQRYAWVYWAHRVARDANERYQYDPDTGVVTSVSEHDADGLRNENERERPGSLEFVEGWCGRRIAAVVVVIIGGAVAAAVCYILLGPQSPLSQRLFDLNQDREEGNDAEGRVAAGALLGLLWMLVGSLLAGAWLVASYLTM